ncbi:MAG: hypothetical protein IJV04_09520, partial [Lachnospiraceae bacterium]|nr:hypothetical protein [Lachnospiraceae bacterium]
MEAFQGEKDTLRSIHLLILATHTFFSFLLFLEDFFLGWEPWVMPLVLFQLVFCWYLHMAQLYDRNIRLHIYALLELLMFFF